MINLKPIIFTLGLTLSKLALFMWLPTLLAFFTGTSGLAEFLAAAIITHIAAFLCLHWGHKSKFRLGVRDMFVGGTIAVILNVAVKRAGFFTVEDTYVAVAAALFFLLLDIIRTKVIRKDHPFRK